MPANIPLDAGKRAALRERIRVVRARLDKVRAHAETAWSTIGFKTLRR